MDNADTINILVGFLQDTMYLAGIPLLVATVVGLIIGMMQAMTQIQDQSLAQTSKIVAIVVVLLVSGSALVTPLLVRTERVFSEIGTF